MIWDKSKFFLSFIVGLLSISTAHAAAMVADSVLVCRSRQCAPAEKIMSREFLYNQFGSLFQNNINQSVLFCEADPTVRVCLNDGIHMDIIAGVTQGILNIPEMILLDAKACPDFNGYTFVADYKMTVNDTYPQCQAALNKMVINNSDDISIQTPGFECRITQNGITLINASYVIDYIDFDYGIVGAYYTIAAGQVSKGGNTGYMLFRFKNISNDMNELRGGTCCECDPSLTPPCQCEPSEPQVVVQEKVVTEYEVAPIELLIKTKAPVEAGKTQDIRVNGINVPGVPVVSDTTNSLKEQPETAGIENLPLGKEEDISNKEPYKSDITAESLAEQPEDPVLKETFGQVEVMSNREPYNPDAAFILPEKKTEEVIVQDNVVTLEQEDSISNTESYNSDVTAEFPEKTLESSIVEGDFKKVEVRPN